MTHLPALLLLLLATTANAATVTAYCPCLKCCGVMGGTGTTASGKQAVQGVTVAGPRSLPMGTKVLISGLGIFTVQDRLAKRYDDRFDVFFTDHNAARQFGRRTLAVRVLPKRKGGRA